MLGSSSYEFNTTMECRDHDDDGGGSSSGGGGYNNIMRNNLGKINKHVYVSLLPTAFGSIQHPRKFYKVFPSFSKCRQLYFVAL